MVGERFLLKCILVLFFKVLPISDLLLQQISRQAYGTAVGIDTVLCKHLVNKNTFLSLKIALNIF